MSTPENAVLMALAQETMRRCYAEEDAISIRQWMEEQLRHMGGSAEDDDAILTWQESFDYYDALLEKRLQDSAVPVVDRKVLDWKWPSWNQNIDPLEPGLLAVVAAPDGQGKTIYAECLSEHWARRKHHVVFVHYELNRAVMMDRRMARHTSIPRRTLRRGVFTPEERELIDHVRPTLLAWDGLITYVHAPGWSMERTTERLRQLKGDGLCDVVLIDYLEKTAASRRQIQLFGASHFQREADNVEQLKNFAESTETPVLMVAQMSKEGKSSSSEAMDRTGIRGAGEKTEKANIVVLLHRDKTKEGGYSNTIDVKIDKNTLGPLTAFQQQLEPEFFRVADITYSPLPGIRR